MSYDASSNYTGGAASITTDSSAVSDTETKSRGSLTMQTTAAGTAGVNSFIALENGVI